MFGFQADFAWEGLVNQWLSRMQYSHPADVFWNITVWSTMENSSVPAAAFWRIIACAYGAAASVSFFRKGAVGSHGLYLVNTTAAHRAPQNVPLHRVWSQSWMHLLVKGHSSASCHSLATSGSHISRQLTSAWRNLKFGAADMKIAFSHICAPGCFMSRGLHEPLSCKLCFVLKAKNTDFHFCFWLCRVKLLS